MSDGWKTIAALCIFSPGGKQEEGIMNLKCSALQLGGKNISDNRKRVQKITVGKTQSSQKLRRLTWPARRAHTGGTKMRTLGVV